LCLYLGRITWRRRDPTCLIVGYKAKVLFHSLYRFLLFIAIPSAVKYKVLPFVEIRSLLMNCDARPIMTIELIAH